jgi:hypothetical protein
VRIRVIVLNCQATSVRLEGTRRGDNDCLTVSGIGGSRLHEGHRGGGQERDESDSKTVTMNHVADHARTDSFSCSCSSTAGCNILGTTRGEYPKLAVGELWQLVTRC